MPLIVLLALVTGVGERMTGCCRGHPTALAALERAHLYVVFVNAAAAAVMALLVARFINRPIKRCASP